MNDTSQHQSIVSVVARQRCKRNVVVAGGVFKVDDEGGFYILLYLGLKKAAFGIELFKKLSQISFCYLFGYIAKILRQGMLVGPPGDVGSHDRIKQRLADI